jgi:hypothetical protein
MIRISDKWIRMRIREAQKGTMDSTDSDPQHFFKCIVFKTYRQKSIAATSVADPDFYSSLIQKQQQNRGVKKICCHIFFCSHKFNKIEKYFIFEMMKKKIWGQFSKNYRNFLPKIYH